MKYPKRVTVIELESAPFRCAKDAAVWAKDHGIVGVMSEVDTGGKGVISISGGSLSKMLSGSAVGKSVTPQIHFSALMRLRDIIRESFQPTKAYSYEINNIEVLKGNCRNASRPSDKTSMDVSILLNGVCDVNGEPLLK